MPELDPFARYRESERKEASVKEGTGHKFVTTAPTRKEQSVRKARERFTSFLKTSRGVAKFGGVQAKRRIERTKAVQRYRALQKQLAQAREEVRRLSA